MSDATLRSDGAGFYQLVVVNTAFRHKNRSSRADFFAAKGQPDEIITAFCFAEQSPVNLNRCTRYTLAIFTVLSQT
jgi:hypothetical protein